MHEHESYDAPIDQLNVLVIDDSEAMRNLLVEIVNGQGHQAISAESAEAGLQLLPLWTFQVAFLDHNLPGMDGIVFGEYLRDNNPDMTVALVTGSDDPKLPRKSRDLQIRFMAKPFETRDVIRVLDEHLGDMRTRAELRQERSASDFAPALGRFLDEIGDAYAIPSVPNRVEDRLVETIKRSLSRIKTENRYSEEERMVALSGLLASRVLGISLPSSNDGHTLFEEYDRIMEARGRRTEFG